MASKANNVYISKKHILRYLGLYSLYLPIPYPTHDFIKSCSFCACTNIYGIHRYTVSAPHSVILQSSAL